MDKLGSDNEIKLGPTFIRPNVLESVRGDKEIATDLRKKFFDALAPVAELINEAEKNGFEVGFAFGKNAFGQTTIAQINIMKKY